MFVQLLNGVGLCGAFLHDGVCVRVSFRVFGGIWFDFGMMYFVLSLCIVLGGC